MSNYQYQAYWSRTVKDTGWIKMSSHIILIQDRKSGQFTYMSEGNIKYKESHLQIHHDFMHKNEYTNNRIISYDCDNLKTYEKGMKEICEAAKFEGGYVSTLKGDDSRYIGVNGQQQTFDFVKTNINNSQCIGVYCYHVDMQKVWKLKNQQQKQSTYTHTHISHQKSPQTKGKELSRSERECRERMRRNTALREEREMKEKLRKEKHENERVLRLEMEYRERMRKKTALREEKEMKEKECRERMRKNTALREGKEMKEKLRKEKQENERILRLEMEYRERMRKKTALREEKEMREREAKEQVRKERERQEKEKEKTYTIVYPAGATVRAGKDISSTVLGVLDFHSFVTVEEVDGRRCRISDTGNEGFFSVFDIDEGWVSLYTVDGQEILKKGVIKQQIEQEQCCNIL